MRARLRLEIVGLVEDQDDAGQITVQPGEEFTRDVRVQEVVIVADDQVRLFETAFQQLIAAPVLLLRLRDDLLRRADAVEQPLPEGRVIVQEDFPEIRARSPTHPAEPGLGVLDLCRQPDAQGGVAPVGLRSRDGVFLGSLQAGEVFLRLHELERILAERVALLVVLLQGTHMRFALEHDHLEIGLRPDLPGLLR